MRFRMENILSYLRLRWEAMSEEFRINMVVLIVLIPCFFFIFCLHVSKVHYNGESAAIFLHSSITNLRPAEGTGILLGNFTLRTSYGNIYVKRFTEVGFIAYKGKYVVSYLDSKPKDRNNDLVIMGNKIVPTAGAAFCSWRDKEIWRQNPDLFSATSPQQDVTIGKYTLHARNIRIIKLPDKETFEFDLENCPERMYLADGTEILNHVSQGNIIDQADMTVFDNGIWEYSHGYGGYVFVKRPGRKEAKRYRYIRFKEDWGDFIDGEEYVEP